MKITPQNWKIVKIGDVCKTNQQNYSPSEKWPFVDYLDTGNITENHIDKIQHFTIGKDALPSRARRKITIDDVIYSAVRPNQKHYGIIKEILPNMLVSTGFIVITANKSVVYPDFLYYYLIQDEITDALQAIGEQSVSTYPTIKPSDLEDVKIALPPLSEQIKIGLTLRTLDDKITNNRKINHHLERIARAIWAEQFGNAEPNGVLNDIIELFDFRRVPLSNNRRSKMEKIYPYYGAATLVDHVDDYLFDGTYLLLGEDGTVIDDCGFPVLQYVWGKFWVNNHAHIIQGRNGFTVDSLCILLKQTNVTSIVTGAVQPKINQESLKALKVFIPSAEEIEQFNTLINPFFTQIRNNCDENRNLVTLRDTLLSSLMTGELFVNDYDDK